MVQTVPKPVRQAQDKPQQARPWRRYRKEKHWKLLQPGWAGTLDDDELAYILAHLKADEKLQIWWGIPPRWKSLPEEVIKRIAIAGSDEDQGHNRKLARPRREPQAAA
jgi:hypothetical protein